MIWFVFLECDNIEKTLWYYSTLYVLIKMQNLPYAKEPWLKLDIWIEHLLEFNCEGAYKVLGFYIKLFDEIFPFSNQVPPSPSWCVIREQNVLRMRIKSMESFRSIQVHTHLPMIQSRVRFSICGGVGGVGHCAFKWILCGHFKPPTNATI